MTGPQALVLKDGSTPNDPRLGRIPAFDPTSRGFQVRELLDELSFRRKRRMSVGATLDQGHEGACTGFSASHAVQSNPFKVKGLTNQTARQWYWLNQQNDEWPGGEYAGADPVYGGSSVNASMRVLRQLGYIDQWRWIGAGSQRLEDDLRDTLKYVGPVCFGVNWYRSMYDTQPNGLLEIDITPTVDGGHAICGHDVVKKRLPGTDKTREYLVLQNSWGENWGVTRGRRGGFAYVRLEDWLELLLHRGEGAVPLRAAA